MSAAEMHLIEAPTIEDLSDHLLHDMPADQAKRPGFRVETDEEATWAARKAARAQAELDRIKAQADAEIAKIREWANDASTSPAHDLEFFEGLLSDYHHRLIDAQGDDLPDTYRVIGAELKRRKNPDTLTIGPDGDENAESIFVQWALANGRTDCLKIEPSVSQTKALIGLVLDLPDLDLDPKGKPKVLGQTSRLVVKETGETVPGAVYRVGDKKASVKLTGGAS